MIEKNMKEARRPLKGFCSSGPGSGVVAYGVACSYLILRVAPSDDIVGHRGAYGLGTEHDPVRAVHHLVAGDGVPGTGVGGVGCYPYSPALLGPGTVLYVVSGDLHAVAVPGVYTMASFGDDLVVGDRPARATARVDTTALGTGEGATLDHGPRCGGGDQVGVIIVDLNIDELVVVGVGISALVPDGDAGRPPGPAGQ